MKFDHVAITSKDIAKSVDWYKNSFDDVKVLYQDETWAIINVCGLDLAFVSPHQHPAHIAFCITQELADERFSDKVFKKHRDGTASCYISDPDGNKIEWLIR
jgi:catechol 2,3-dioxygenase-like lactoylglutathione lyase family enzyme